MSGFVSHSVFIVATWIAAVCGGIGIGAAFVSAIVGYQLTENALSEANEKISTARSEADSKIEIAREEAKVELGKAQADIVRANALGEKAKADAADANRKAETERLERLKLEAIVAPRRLSAEQKAAMATVLSSFAGQKVRIKSYGLDTEAAIFGQQIIEVLTAANIQFDDRRMGQGSLGQIEFGVRVTGDNPGLVASLLSAFLKIARVAAFNVPVPPSAGTTLGDDGSQVAATIFVGAKPIVQ